MRHIQILFFIMFFLGISKNAYCVNLFESKFIKVEIETNNAYETKLKSIEEIKIKSIEKITNKILDDENKIAFTKFLNDNNFLNELIQNIIIENEIITNQKYMAEIKVNFDKKKIINILRNYQINYSDIIPPTFLLIISHSYNFINIGLEKNNQLYDKLRERINSNDNLLLSYHFPELDSNDRYILPYEKIIIEDKKAYKKLLEKYNTEKGFYIKIQEDHSKNKLKILLKLFDKDLNKFFEITKIELFLDDNKKNINSLDPISAIILHKLDSWWKNENKIENNIVNSIQCIIKSNNFNDFNYIKSKINELSQVVTIKPIKIELNNSIEMIKYYGNISIFSKSLYSRGLILKDPKNCLITSNL